MNTDYLRELYESGHFSIHERFEDWHDAVRACIQPLVDDGSVEAGYADSIFRAVDEYGPYICIAPDICLPHAINSGNVRRTAICFMKCNTPVVFDQEENHQSTVFFALAANNSEAHLSNMKKLMKMLDQEDLVEALIQAQTENDFKALIYPAS